MTEILQANIFFFIASFATIVFSIMACIAMYLIIKILISIRAILARIEAGSDLIADDILAARAFVTSGGLISHLIGFVAGAFGTRTKASRKRKNKELVITDKE
ncbi:hypothetical protein K2P47_02665 [Patescibacteria group bacterium]|nr:hypothetical protein [Patescibacteria group bacterium]